MLPMIKLDIFIIPAIKKFCALLFILLHGLVAAVGGVFQNGHYDLRLRGECPKLDIHVGGSRNLVSRKRAILVEVPCSV